VRPSLGAPEFGLADNAFFTGLDASALARLLPVFRVISLPAGAELYANGRTAEGVFLIVCGRVQVVQRTGGIETTIAELGPGEFTGERALLTPPERHAWTAICREGTRLAYADGEAVLAALAAAPAIGVNVARAFHRRVRDATQAIDALIESP
jgi:CRP-like cAMP-binding protein